MGTVAAPNIRKEQFENRDRGWIGVCIIDGKGDVQGKSVGPGERVWLSEAEKIVTAEAPRDPKDNPFVPQVRIREADDGMGGVRREEYELTPLVRVTDARFVPGSDRYVPPPLGDSSAEAFAEADGVASRASDTRAEVEHRVVEGAASRDVPPPPARAAQAVAGRLGGQDHEAPPEEPAPTPATLGGENPSETEEAAVEEEHAAQVDPEVGEETGAAQAPAGDPVGGEYAAMEEVGTPDAPNANQAGPPAPWTPGSQPGSVAPPGDLT